MTAFIIRAKYGEDFLYTLTPYFIDVPPSNELIPGTQY